ncbi:MAG: galactose-1-phosphate uridylyltransferase, partial [Rhodothermales bacterium]|nr:galactose-1-phosphate uridylyltransferase [Rhodothermales bacterium]
MPNSRTERRFNPLSGDWVLVSEGRTNRPWNGQVEPNVEQEVAPRYSENCHLCPGNTRVSGHKNTNYSGVYVFENDFPAIARASTESPETDAGKPLYYRSEEEFGECRVVCFSDDHSLTLAQMTTSQIEPVIRCYQDQTDDLLSQPGLTHVQIFENRGAAMGCSNPHPHGQIWAQSRAPSIPARECHAMSSYKRETGSSLLTDYCRDEANSEERVVCANEHFVAVV